MNQYMTELPWEYLGGAPSLDTYGSCAHEQSRKVVFLRLESPGRFFMHEVYREYYQDRSLWWWGQRWTLNNSYKKPEIILWKAVELGEPHRLSQIQTDTETKLPPTSHWVQIANLGLTGSPWMHTIPRGHFPWELWRSHTPSSRKIEHFSFEGSGGSGQQTTASTPVLLGSSWFT